MALRRAHKAPWRRSFATRQGSRNVGGRLRPSLRGEYITAFASCLSSGEPL
jgi:hypothetical protein